MDYVSTKSMNDWFFFTFLILFIFTAISCLAFAQFTLRRIEKQIKKDGISDYKALDFGGTRIVTYAYVILFSESISRRLAQLIDTDLIRNYANHADWWRSLFFIMTSHLWICTGLLGALLVAES